MNKNENETGDIKISVVLPVFNSEAHLALLLSSLLAQSLTSIEVIAINDGSSDASLAMLQDMAAKDPRLVVFSQANMGLSAARNHGLRHARGKWIAFADSDDWLSPTMFETWCRHAEDASLDVVVGNAFPFVEHPAEGAHVAMFKDQPWQEVVSGTEWIKRSTGIGEWPHYVWLQLVRRELLVKNKFMFTEGIVHEDILWTLQIALVAKRMGFVQMPMYGYRTNPASITNNPSLASSLRRAESYIVIANHLLACANLHTDDASLRRALLRHTNHEGGHFLGLVRKRVRDATQRRDLAQRFSKHGLPDAMFEGATNVQELWRAIRSWFILRKFAAARALPVAEDKNS